MSRKHKLLVKIICYCGVGILLCVVFVINPPAAAVKTFESTPVPGSFVLQLPEHNFDDLLDAMWVESKGDANATGDWGVWIEFAYDYSSRLSEVGQGVHLGFGDGLTQLKKEKGKNYYRKAKAIGAYQLHKIYVDDVNSILGQNKYTYADRWDRDKSREMVRIYTVYYAATADAPVKDCYWEDCARIHNGGPDGWRDDPNWFVRNREYTKQEAEQKIANTKEFWAKVKARMETK